MRKIQNNNGWGHFWSRKTQHQRERCFLTTVTAIVNVTKASPIDAGTAMIFPARIPASTWTICSLTKHDLDRERV